jgi:preprotein translocase subunit SecA
MRYEEVTEGRRLAMVQRRQGLLDGSAHCASERERLISLTTVDDLWADYLAALAQLRDGVQWVSLTGGVRDPVQNYFKFGGFDPFREYVKQVHDLFEQLQATIDMEIAERATRDVPAGLASRRGATWTYITTDQPFGLAMQHALRALFRKPS